jgi:NAD(P)-dependent dehydrogenase (short-subunit alcohol dehydrogenase family)
MPDVDPAGWLLPEVLAGTLLFLCSPESAALTGANLLAGG